jgi:hypothetical protein
MRSSGIPKAAGRTSSVGPPKAKSRPPNSKSIAPGGELSQSGPAVAELAARMDPNGARELEAAGVIDGKFGPVTLLRLAGSADEARACLGFIKRLDEPNLQISGWSCQGDALPAQRAAIGCILNRLILLTTGNEPKLAELFARTELKRGSCSISHIGWLSGLDDCCGEPRSARQVLNARVCQDAGFHATFWHSAALL